jgi:hypothetical protein
MSLIGRPGRGPAMIHYHWLSIVGTIVFVVSACAILTFSTATFAAIWVGRGGGAPSGGRPTPPSLDPDNLG